MVKNNELRLRVYYDCDEPDSKMDEAIEKVVKKFGWKFEGTGYTFRDSQRDLTFYKGDNVIKRLN